jgi:hypothetical protein
MMNLHLNRALAVAATLLLASGAAAQSSHASPTGKANAAPEANKAGDHLKADPAPANAPAPDPAAKDADRAARRAAELEAERAELRGIVHGPMSDALKQELVRHAQRLARLERIKSLAQNAKDADALDRATKLLDKENARHQKFLSTAQASEANAKAQKGDQQ